MSRRRLALAALGLGAAALAAAFLLRRPPAPLPAVPEFPLETMEPAVRDQFAAARARLERAPRDAEAAGALGMLFHAYGFHALAQSCYERARALAPREPAWGAYLARVLVARGRWEEASALLAPAGDLPSLVLKADADRRLGRLDAALAGFRQALDLRPGLPQAHCGAGRVHLQRGEVEPAIEHLEAAVAAAPAYGTARYALGQALRRAGRLDEAREQLALAETQREVEPALDDPLMSRVAALRRGAIDALHAGIDHLRAGRLDEALPLLETAARLDPDLAEAHSQLGTALLLAGETVRAETHLRRAIEIEPDFVDAHYNLGLIEHRRGALEAAVAHFERAAAVRPDHFEAHLGLGTDLRALGRHAEAIEHLARAAALEPDDARPCKRLAGVQAEAGRHAEALATLRAGVARFPDDASVADRLAWHLATCPDPALRDPAAALTLAEAVAARTRRRVPTALATLAASLAAAGRFEDALAVVAEAAAQADDEDLLDQLDAQARRYRRGELLLGP